MNNEKIDVIIFYFLLIVVFLNLIFPGEIYFTSRYLTLLISFTLCFLFLINRLQHKKPPTLNIPYRGLFLFIIILLFISTFTSVNYHRSRNVLFLFLCYAIVYLLVLNIKVDKKHINILLLGIFIITIIIVIYGFYQYFYKFDYLLKELKNYKHLDAGNILDAKKRLEDRRIFSTFALPTTLAGFLALILPLALAKSYLSWRNNRKTLLFYLPLVILCFAGMIVTGSFGAIVSLILAALIAFLLLFYKRKEFKRVIIYLIILGLLFIISLFALSHLRGFPLWNLKAPTNPIMLRLENWNVAVKLARDFPLLGAGLGNYGTLYPKYMTIERSGTQFAHNSLLQFTGEIGWLATIMIGILIFLLFHNSIKHIRGESKVNIVKEANIIKSALLVSCLTFTFHNLIDIALYFPSIGLLGVFIFSLLIKSVNQDKIEQKGKKRLSHAYKITIAWIVLILFILISIWITCPLNAFINSERAIEAVEEQDYDKGLKLISSSLFWDSKNSEYYTLRARMTMAAPEDIVKDLDTVVKDYQEAIQYNPYTPYLHFELSEIYLSRGWFVSAYIEAYEAKRLYPLSKKYSEHLKKCQLLMEKVKTKEKSK